MAPRKQKKFLRQLLERDISQLELASKVGVHPSLISLIARGWRKPSPELIIKIEHELEAQNLFD